MWAWLMLATVQSRKKRVYRNERGLVRDLISCLRGSKAGPWRVQEFATEFEYRRGRTDIIAVDEDGDVVAIEAKITRWRDALRQAYRNRCFAHRSYIVVPKPVAIHAASESEDEFTRRRVGLCYVERGDVIISIEAEKREPIQLWLTAQALVHASYSK